jgi:hypothetical protein
MQNYNSTLQTNNSSLQEIITQLNNMPDAGDGLDTSDATASASDILSGKTAYVKGSKITGTIAFQPAQTITPGITNQTIASGKYLTGAQTIKGDANLVASNIVSGKSIFGVVGTAITGGGGGDHSVEDMLVNRTLTSYTNDRATSIGRYAFYYYSSLTAANFTLCQQIWDYAFGLCSKLSSINFPQCSYMAKGAFINCYALTSAIFPNCSHIGEAAFESCSSLTNISFPSCTTIERDAFAMCYNLTNFSFPKCKTIDMWAFNACSKLESIYLGASTVCKLSHSNAFSKTGIGSNKGSIFVPSSLVASYKKASDWSYFSNRIFSYEFT